MTDPSAAPATLTCASREAIWELPCLPQAAGRARDLTRAALASWGLAAVADDVTLIVSELVTNAVVHAEAPIELRLLTEGRMLRGEVTDHSTRTPVPVIATPEQERGRGLALVQAYADRWGIDPAPTGKTVWFLRKVA